MVEPLSYRAHARAILALGLPLIGSQVAQFAIHVTDTLMLGWYDTRALAAVTLAGSYWFMLFVIGAGFGMAVAPMVATAEARGDRHHVRRVVRAGMHVSLVHAVLVLPLMFWSAPVLRALGQEGALSLLAQDYLRIACWGTLPALVVMVLRSCLSALERTWSILLVTLGAVGLNILVNHMLIFGNWGAPEMGVRGAAVASVGVQVMSALLLALHIRRVLPGHALFMRFYRLDPGALRGVFRLGLPIGLTQLSETGLFMATAVMVGWLGVDQLAAHGIALQAVAMAFMVHVGLSNAATVRAGSAVGRGERICLLDGARVAVALSFGFALLMIAAFLLFPEGIIGLFLSPDDPMRGPIIGIGRSLLVVAALFQLADATQVMALGLLRGIGDTRVPMLIAALAYWPLGLGAGHVLGFVVGLGAVGIWLGLVVGLTVAGGLLMWRFWHLARRVGQMPPTVAPAAG